MKLFFQLARTIFVISMILGTLVACGGSGGGSESGSGFTGVQTLAVIDDSNAQQLAIDAYNGGAMSDSLVVPVAVGQGSNQPLAPLGMVMFNSLPQMNFIPTVTTLATETTTILGTCGGSATQTITDNDTSASGSIFYDNYCDDGVTLSGTMLFSATLDTQTNVVSMTMSFNDLTSGEGSLTGTISMNMNIADPFAAMTMRMNFVLTDPVQRTYWIDHYTITISPGTMYDTTMVSGTYHDFDAGHVIITTTDALQVDQVTGVPNSGNLHFAGADGTYADLTATGGGSYTLTISNGTIINGSF
jgi:hypothetical protein